MIVDSKEGERECVVFERKGVERVSYSMRNVGYYTSHHHSHHHAIETINILSTHWISIYIPIPRVFCLSNSSLFFVFHPIILL